MSNFNENSNMNPSFNLIASLKKRELGLDTMSNSNCGMREFVELKGAHNCTKDSTISFDIESERPLSYEPILASAINFRKRLIASGHSDQKVRLSSLDNGLLERSHSCETPYVNCVVFHPTLEDIMATGTRLGEVRVWKLKSGTSVSWKTECQIESLSFHPCEMTLLVASNDSIYFWDCSSLAPLARISTRNPLKKVLLARFDASGENLLTGIGIADLTTRLPRRQRQLLRASERSNAGFFDEGVRRYYSREIHGFRTFDGTPVIVGRSLGYVPESVFSVGSMSQQPEINATTSGTQETNGNQRSVWRDPTIPRGLQGFCENTGSRAAYRIPQSRAACRIPQDRAACRIPQNRAAGRMPQNRSAGRIPQNRSACRIPQNKAAEALPAKEKNSDAERPRNRFVSTSRMDTSLFKAYITLVKEEEEGIIDSESDGEDDHVVPGGSSMPNSGGYIPGFSLTRSARVGSDRRECVLQLWKYGDDGLPDITNRFHNVVVQKCRFTLASSVDISKDGNKLACFVSPSSRNTYEMTNAVIVVSLKKHERGRVLYCIKPRLLGVCVQFSPEDNFLAVGVRISKKSKKRAIIINLGPKMKAKTIKRIKSDQDNPLTMSYVTTNTINWLEAGEGLVYGTSLGEIHICRVPNFADFENVSQK